MISLTALTVWFLYCRNDFCDVRTTFLNIIQMKRSLRSYNIVPAVSCTKSRTPQSASFVTAGVGTGTEHGT
jgi:hypothetical protein